MWVLLCSPWASQRAVCVCVCGGGASDKVTKLPRLGWICELPFSASQSTELHLCITVPANKSLEWTRWGTFAVSYVQHHLINPRPGNTEGELVSETWDQFSLLLWSLPLPAYRPLDCSGLHGSYGFGLGLRIAPSASLLLRALALDWAMLWASILLWSVKGLLS